MVDVDKLRQVYPKGTRVRLLKMDDPRPIPIGTLGAVLGVDDIASLRVDWDNGRRLNVLYGEDEVEIVD